jgi:DNA-binding transcriptional ArsR family regulator
MTAVKSLKHLLVSQTRLKLLQTIFYLPNEYYYVRELTRIVKEEINSVRRELKNLKTAGLINSEWRANRLYYWANPNSLLFKDLLSLVHKTSGFGLKVSKNKQKTGQIKYLIYSQNFIRNLPNSGQDLDFLIVGRVIIPEVGELVREEEKRRGREVNYTVVSQEEFSMRLKNRDPFVVDLLLGDRVFIIGDPLDI